MKLEYNISKEQYILLAQAGICNGVGGAGHNIEKLLLANIELLPYFDIDKANKLLDDIRQLAIRHDIEFYFRLGFYRANFRFAKGLFHLLHWSSFWKRLGVALLALTVLNKYGKEFYFHNKLV